MKGDQQIIETLNEILSGELTAINQYYAHYKMCANWGYERLSAKKKAESLEEMRHADLVIERILFLDGHPNMQRLGQVVVGEAVPEQHRADLEMELMVQQRLTSAIALCLSKGDHGTRALLEDLLEGTEEGIDWLEAQLGQIEELGKERYLAEQIHS